MHQSRPFTLLGLFIIAALGLAACTDSSPTVVGPDGGARQIAVSGRGEASADPDTVLLSLGVSVLRDSVSIAVADAASAMNEVLAVLRRQGVNEDDIQTTNCAIFPEFDFTRNNERELRGFRVSNQVRVKLRDVDTAGDLIDQVATVGGDDVLINGISFTIDDPQELAGRGP